MAIRVTPDQLRDMASKLRNYASQASSLASQINSAVNAGTGEWEGNAQREYVARYREIEPTLKQKLPELLETMAKNASDRADAYEQADR